MATKRIGIMPNPSSAKASLARRRLINQLRRSKVEAAAHVADFLDACSTSRPCWSAACLICGAVFQERLVAVGNQFIRTPSDSVRNRTHALSIEPPSVKRALIRTDADLIVAETK
jgi:hypothetical protein